MIFRTRTRRHGIKPRQKRRRQLAGLISRSPRMESLEDRRLLAVVSYDAVTDALTFTADAGEQHYLLLPPG
jgi:hypothetical protein